MARLDHAPGNAVGRPKRAGEVLPDHAAVGPEEARVEQLEDRVRPLDMARLARALPQQQQAFEQVHVRVLPPPAADGGQLLDEAP